MQWQFLKNYSFLPKDLKAYLEKIDTLELDIQIVVLNDLLQHLEAFKYDGPTTISNLYNPNSPPGTKKIVVHDNKKDDKLIIDQHTGTFNRLLSHSIAALQYLETSKNAKKDDAKKTIVNILADHGKEIYNPENRYRAAIGDNRKDMLPVLQNIFAKGQGKLASTLGIKNKELLKVDDIATFIRPIVVNTHIMGDGTEVKQRFEPVTNMTDAQKNEWRTIVTSPGNEPSWYNMLTEHHQERYSEYASDAMQFETGGFIDKLKAAGDTDAFRAEISTSDLSDHRKTEITYHLARAGDANFEDYKKQLLDSDPWYMLSMPKSSANRYAPLASNHVRVITTVTKVAVDGDGNETANISENITYVRSNEVIIKSPDFSNNPFDYSVMKNSKGSPIWQESNLDKSLTYLSFLPHLIIIPIALIIDSFIDLFTDSTFKNTKFHLKQLWSFVYTPDRYTPDIYTPTKNIIETTETVVEQIYADFLTEDPDNTGKYDDKYIEFLSHNGLNTGEKLDGGYFRFKPILHSTSLLSPLPDCIENSYSIGSRLFGADNNKKMLLYKLAAISKINERTDGAQLLGGAKINCINFAANDYRRMAISGFGNKIHKHNNHASVDLLLSVLNNNIVALAHAGQETDNLIKAYKKIKETCELSDDYYDLTKLIKSDITELENLLKPQQNVPNNPQLDSNLKLSLKSITEYIKLYKNSMQNIPENEQILLASYANMMVNASSGSSSRVETHCKSGRDRTFVVQIYEQAMQAYFIQHGKLPVAAEQNKNDREKFVNIYVELFMQGLAQENSNQNQHGSFGLNNILIQRPWPLCILAGTLDPKSTCLLPDDILQNILKKNPDIAAQNESQRFNGKHVDPNSLNKSPFLNWLSNVSGAILELALSPLFACCVIANKIMPNYHPFFGGIFIFAGVVTGLVFIAPLLPAVAMLATGILVISSLYYGLNPQRREVYRSLTAIVAGIATPTAIGVALALTVSAIFPPVAIAATAIAVAAIISASSKDRYKIDIKAKPEYATSSQFAQDIEVLSQKPNNEKPSNINKKELVV